MTQINFNPLCTVWISLALAAVPLPGICEPTPEPTSNPTSLTSPELHASTDQKAEFKEIASRLRCELLPPVKDTPTAEQLALLPIPKGLVLWGLETHPVGGPLRDVQIACMPDTPETEKIMTDPALLAKLGPDAKVQKLDLGWIPWIRFVLFRTVDLVTSAENPSRFLLSYSGQQLGLASLVVPPDKVATQALLQCSSYAFSLSGLVIDVVGGTAMGGLGGTAVATVLQLINLGSAVMSEIGCSESVMAWNKARSEENVGLVAAQGKAPTDAAPDVASPPRPRPNVARWWNDAPTDAAPDAPDAEETARRSRAIFYKKMDKEQDALRARREAEKTAKDAKEKADKDAKDKVEAAEKAAALKKQQEAEAAAKAADEKRRADERKRDQERIAAEKNRAEKEKQDERDRAYSKSHPLQRQPGNETYPSTLPHQGPVIVPHG